MRGHGLVAVVSWCTAALAQSPCSHPELRFVHDANAGQLVAESDLHSGFAAAFLLLSAQDNAVAAPWSPQPVLLASVVVPMVRQNGVVFRVPLPVAGPVGLPFYGQVAAFAVDGGLQLGSIAPCRLPSPSGPSWSWNAPAYQGPEVSVGLYEVTWLPPSPHTYLLQIKTSVALGGGPLWHQGTLQSAQGTEVLVGLVTAVNPRAAPQPQTLWVDLGSATPTVIDVRVALAAQRFGPASGMSFALATTWGGTAVVSRGSL